MAALQDIAADEDRIWHSGLRWPAQHSPGWAYESAKDYTTEFAVEPVDPVDLWGKFDPPTLPRGLLPPLIEDFAFDRGMTMGCDMAGLAVGALAVCAAAIPDTIQLQPKKHDTRWLESARLWVALVGPPSTMKTPMMNAAVAPLRRIDNEMARENQTRDGRVQQAVKGGKAAEGAAQADPDHDDGHHDRGGAGNPEGQPDGVLCYQDELSGWFGSMDKYSGARGSAKDRAFWLEAYNGGSYTVNRIQRGTVFIEHLSVSMLGGIQPEPIRKLAGDSDDDGLLQRFIPIVLRPAVIGRDEAPSGVRVRLQRPHQQSAPTQAADGGRPAALPEVRRWRPGDPRGA